MKTYTQFIAEAPTEAEVAKIAPGISAEKRRAALEKNARNQARRDTPTTPKKQSNNPNRNPPPHFSHPLSEPPVSSI